MAPESYFVEPVVPDLRRFVDDFRNLLDRGLTGQPLLHALEPPTERLVDDPSWIADEWRRPQGELATWAMYRSQDPELGVFTTAVPPGAMTKVIHLTDGWVARVQGVQIERMYRRRADGTYEGFADLELTTADPVTLGELSPLYPDLDIHQVATAGDEPSVSPHVFGNDLGAVERQSFAPEEQTVVDLVSGYTNVDGRSNLGR
jgi:predicted metal-dependent enzyme (double-stranded beta helix superfamily)